MRALSPSSRQARRARGERGVTIVEAALVLPILAVIFLGIVEYGLAWRDVDTLERGLQTAARVGSGTGKGRYADYEALRSLSASLSGMAGADIRRVIIYNVSAGNTTGAVPPACLAVTPTGSSAGVSGVCNVYSASQVAATSPSGFRDTGTGSCAGSWDSNWCPGTRDDSPPLTDRLGVYVEVDYRPITNLLPGPTFSIDRQAVYYVEPCIPGNGVAC